MEGELSLARHYFFALHHDCTSIAMFRMLAKEKRDCSQTIGKHRSQSDSLVIQRSKQGGYVLSRLPWAMVGLVSPVPLHKSG